MKKQKLLIAGSISLVLLFIFSTCEAQEPLHDTYPPLPEAVAALDPDFRMNVTKTEVAEWEEGTNFYYAFKPAFKDPTVGFIIYPGALVDPVAYAPTARAIAQQGYLVVIVKMVQDLAILSYTRADKIITDYPAIKKWIIGGHSLGGVMACAYAKQFTDKVQGVVIWAAFPSESFRIDDKPLKAISIYGTKDAAVEDIKADKIHLPPDTVWVEIAGGNHTQFGYYWDGVTENFVQVGDNPADITREEQQKQIIKATSDFLAQFKDNTCPVVYLLGSADARLGTLRRFRDTMLAQSAAGKELIALYCGNGARITAFLEQQSLIKACARKVLEISIPAVELIMDF